MTARAYPARKVAKPRVAAKARLLEFLGADGSQQYMGARADLHERTVKRLLSAVLREELAAAADRAGDVAAATLDEMAHELLMPDDADVERVWRVRLRAAVLASSGRRKGRK